MELIHVIIFVIGYFVGSGVTIAASYYYSQKNKKHTINYVQKMGRIQRDKSKVIKVDYQVIEDKARGIVNVANDIGKTDIAEKNSQSNS